MNLRMNPESQNQQNMKNLENLRIDGEITRYSLPCSVLTVKVKKYIMHDGLRS